MRLIGFSLLVLLLASCNIPAKLSMQSSPGPYPEEFSGAERDTMAIGNLPFNTVFTDEVLLQLIDTMLQHNFELQQADRRIAIAQTAFVINSQLNKPTLEAALGVQADKYGFYTMNGIGNFDMNKSPNVTPEMRVPDPFVPDLFVGLRSRWEIDVWGKMRAMKEASLKRFFAEQAGRNWLITQLVAELSNTYFEWSALLDELEVVDRNVRLQENALEVVKALKAGGRATELAVQQMAAQVYRTTALRYSLRQQVAVAQNRMNYLCGRFPENIQRGRLMLDQQVPDIIQAGIPAGLLSARPDLIGALQHLSAAFHDVEAARAAFLPSLVITPYFGWQGFRLPAFFNAESIATGAAAQLGAPLFARKQIRGQYQVANLELDRHWLEYKRIFREAVGEVQNSLIAIENLKMRFEYKQKELDLLKAAANTANDLYSSGFANYLEVITAQQTLLDADLELVHLKKLQMQQLVMLYRSTGGGWRN